MNKENFAIVAYLLIGSYFIIFPFLPNSRPFNLVTVTVGILLIIFALTGLYNKALFSRKIYKITVIPLVLAELFALIYIFIVIPESHNFILLITLIIILIISYAALLSFNLMIKTRRYHKGTEILDELKYNDALEYFDEYVNSNQDDPLAWSGKAITQSKLNKLDEALKCTDNALKIRLGLKYFLIKKEIHAIRVSVKLNVLFDLERYGEALKLSNELLKLKPDSSISWNNKGIILSRLGRYEEALECINKALNLNPKDPFALSNKGETLRKMGYYSEAMNYINESININPKLPFVWLNKGETFMAMNKNEKALEYIDKSLELDPIYKAALKTKEDILESMK